MHTHMYTMHTHTCTSTHTTRCRGESGTRCSRLSPKGAPAHHRPSLAPGPVTDHLHRWPRCWESQLQDRGGTQRQLGVGWPGWEGIGRSVRAQDSLNRFGPLGTSQDRVGLNTGPLQAHPWDSMGASPHPQGQGRRQEGAEVGRGRPEQLSYRQCPDARAPGRGVSPTRIVAGDRKAESSVGTGPGGRAREASRQPRCSCGTREASAMGEGPGITL